MRSWTGPRHRGPIQECLPRQFQCVRRLSVQANRPRETQLRDQGQSKGLKHIAELGWNDLDTGRVQDFEPESIKQRGRGPACAE